ncbi:MAG: hypothetical protein B7Z60_09505 [Ferrovum sp. 37-45-19]|uniref:hypothetical protein n=1 Tax=Ferrovum sp. JA12 TaxID=1356299 RepID=UPI0007029A49|nr:hypothetical protein [Ferrovum sp. JA12]OYV78695.1 MAG: hypothetical protein B7Z65_09240 [Ferrovum sp. 21-44-67]OYV93177.1 MAG: hypothetical protein B7Z60_09505 [Ferrovum sp. 37-45-19]HQT82433.1 hypothetical protein [Ferrovaceae bacterium]KRH78998.1 hypothetical protein FERRO_00590 [Ferrovum sp. JA12]HQU07399.1 hypothetical protein [Ferrovaceae bacterium]
MSLGAYISIGSAVTAFVSATLWVIADRARVSYDPKPNEDGFYPSGISDGDDDFIETLKKQGEWNRWAAYSAAIAAALQGISMLLQVIESS